MNVIPLFLSSISIATAELDVLGLYGFLAACGVLTAGWLTLYRPGWHLGLAAAYVNLSGYAIAAGAWPVAMVLATLAGVSVWKWRVTPTAGEEKAGHQEMQRISTERAERLFGAASGPRRQRYRESDN